MEKYIFSCLEDIQQNYLKIGFLLKQISDSGAYAFCSFERDDGSFSPCKDVTEYALLRFGLSKTVTFNSIKIVEKFTSETSEENISLYSWLSNFGYSALTELLPLAKNDESGGDPDEIFPAWVKREIQPDMSVKEIRQAKARHRKVIVKSAADKSDAKDDPDEKEEKVVDKKETGSFHILRNDGERKLLFQQYRLWDVFCKNEYLGLTYYRVYLGDGIYAVAIEWMTDEPYYVKENGGFRYRLHLLEKGKPFSLDVCSVSTFLKIMHEKDLNCDSEVWDRIKSSK
ncbi:MAG: hypothetical protein IJ735_00930 [Clostridia bacterium]|nr:hypothetical protein [Clostridia bacterium]